MAKISQLPPADPLDGTETVPIVQAGETKGINPVDHLAYIALGAELARDQAADLVLPQHIFVDVALAVAEAAVPVDTVFKLVDSATGLAEVRRRSVAGSDYLYNEATTAALVSPLGGRMIGMADGAIAQDAIAVAANPAALLASVKALAVGSSIRTADGFVYKVAPGGAADHHLTTVGGAKLYVVPQGPSARQWGVIPDAGIDVWPLLQRALDNQPEVKLEEGEYRISRGLRQTINGSILRGAGIGKTIVRAISPTGDQEFGGTNGSEAAVWAMAPEGDPLFGLKCEDMTLDCAGLWTGLPVGDVGLKGHHYRRVHNFEVNRVEVLDCRSYAFWANDKTIESGGVITGASGVYNDCVAKDAHIFFETTGRCNVTYNRPRAEQTRDNWDWEVHQVYHFYGGDGIITVNDGYAMCNSSTIIGPLLTMKNVTFNRGHYEQLNPLTTVVNMSGDPTGNFDDWAFNDVSMRGAHVGAFSFGGLSGPDNKMTVKGGKMIATAGTGPTFTPIAPGWGSVDMLGVDCQATTADAAVPFALIVAGPFKNFNVFGGNQEVFGPSAEPSPVNAPTAKFTSTTMLPASVVTEKVRQSKRISQAFASSGGGAYGQINFAMPLNVADRTKLVAQGCIAASTTDLGGGEAIAFSRNNPGENFVNILCPPAGIGRTWVGIVIEYE